MKFCTNCGKALDDNAKFCTGCGQKCAGIILPTPAPVKESVDISQDMPLFEDTAALTPEEAPSVHKDAQSIPQKEKKIKEKKKGSKGKIILFSILGALLLIALILGVLALLWYNSPEQKILRALDADDYQAAIEVITDNQEVSESESLAEELKTRIEALKTGFIDGSMEYITVNLELQTIDALNVASIESILRDTTAYIYRLNESRTYFATAESFYNTGNYAEAIFNYQLVIKEDANYNTAISKLSASVDGFRNAALDEALAYAQSQLYPEAIAVLNEALLVIPGDAQIVEQIKLYESSNSDKIKSDALEEAAALAESGDLPGAFKLIAATIETMGADAELESAYKNYTKKYVSQEVKAVDKLVKKKDFEGAISRLTKALKELPDNKTLSEKLEEVKAKQPISITTLNAINTDEWGRWNEGSPTDPFGNDYSKACNFVTVGSSWLGQTAYSEYRLYKKYTTLTGTIATHTDTYKERISRLQIYADDVLVYTSKDLGRKTDAINFSVSVAGAEYIKIVITTETSAYAILSDVQLWP